MPSTSTIKDVRKDASSLVIRPLPTPPASRRRSIRRSAPKESRKEAAKNRRRQSAANQVGSEATRAGLLRLQEAAAALSHAGLYHDAARALQTALQLALRFRVALVLGKRTSDNQALVALVRRLRSAGVIDKREFKQLVAYELIPVKVDQDYLASLERTVGQLAASVSIT